MSRLDWRDLESRMRGAWPAFLVTIGMPESALQNRHGPCPMCGGRDRFRFDDHDRGTWICNVCGAGDGVKLFMLYANIGFSEAVKAIAAFLGNRLDGPEINQKSATQRSPATSRPTPPTRQAAAMDLWRASRTIRRGDDVDVYLRGRGIALDDYPKALRFSPIAPYFDGDIRTDRFSAMVAAVTGPDGELRTVHRTYLRAGRKAAVGSPKKLAGKIGLNASIKLFAPSDVLHVAEGIETALAVRIITSGAPVWSLINAGNMAKFEPPPAVKRIVIWADNDPSFTGQACAYEFARRLRGTGREANVMVPDKSGEDWNDVLLRTHPAE